MSAIKEYFAGKWKAFKILFQDPELRVLSIVSLIILILLISIKYLMNVLYISAIAIVALVIFSYILYFLIVFDFFALVSKKIRVREEREKHPKAFWGVRIIAIILVILYYLNVLGGIALFTLFIGSFFLWSLIMCFQITKLLVELSLKSHHRILRSLFYILISLGYVAYLALMFVFASDISSINIINDTVLDWILSLAIFYFSLAGLGQFFLRKVEIAGGNLKNLSWRDDLKMRNAVLSILFLAIGYEIFMRGLPAVVQGITFVTTTKLYYEIQLFIFIPLMVVGIVVVLVKRTKLVPK